VAHDHRAGLDPDAHRQLHPVLGGEASVERGNLIDDREAGADCALCVVLVR
jgi:hypothetical protein